MEIISVLEFSKRIGIGEKSIRDAIRLGKIVEGLDTSGKKPKIKYEIALKEVEEIGIGAKSKSCRLDKTISEGTPATEETGDLSVVMDMFKSITVETASYKESRRREAYFKSELSRLEFEEKEGSLVKKDDVYKELFDFGSELKTKILALPDRITDELISISNNRDAFYNLLYSSLRETLETLSRSKTVLDK